MTGHDDLHRQVTLRREGGPVRAWADTCLLAQRALLRSARSPGTAVQTVIFPAVLMLLLLVCFGALAATDRATYLQRLVPLIVLSGAWFGAIPHAVGLYQDRETGVLARLRAMPLWRGAPVAGAVLAELLRAFVGSILIVLVAFAVGFRFTGGAGAAVAFFPLAVLFGTAPVWLALALALRAKSPDAIVTSVNMPAMLLFFLSSGFVPLDAFPAVLQPVVRVNPLSVWTETLSGLVTGGLVWSSLLWSALWLLGAGALAATAARRQFAAAR